MKRSYFIAQPSFIQGGGGTVQLFLEMGISCWTVLRRLSRGCWKRQRTRHGERNVCILFFVFRASMVFRFARGEGRGILCAFFGFFPPFFSQGGVSS